MHATMRTTNGVLLLHSAMATQTLTSSTFRVMGKRRRPCMGGLVASWIVRSSAAPVSTVSFAQSAFFWVADKPSSHPSFPFRPEHRHFATSCQNAVDALDVLVLKIRQMQASRRATAASTSPSPETSTLRDRAHRLFASYAESAPIRFHKGCARAAFISRLAVEYGLPTSLSGETSLDAAVEHYKVVQESNDPDLSPISAVCRLRSACTTEYEDLFSFLIQQNAVEGMKFLLSLRRDVLQWLPWLQKQTDEGKHEHAELLAHLKQLDAHLRKIFEMWFSPGMLQVEPMTYGGTPASVIETIARHEAVHPMKSLDDLRERLGPDRRVFGLFHPLLDDRPLIVIHVALQPDIPSSMVEVHTCSSVENAQVATFYSISNLEPALRGVGLGEYLISEAVNRIRNELAIETYVTLSPMPGFRHWIENLSQASGKFAASQDLIGEHLLSRLSRTLECEKDGALLALLELLKERGPSGELMAQEPDSDRLASIARDVMVRLAAHYVVNEQHRGRPLDGVARFHISNGAAVYRVNWAADLSAQGWRRSFGLMMNYHYKLNDLTAKQAAYEASQVVAVSESVQEILS